MSIIEALLLGLVQGFTEFVPVSSSGHLLLTQEALGIENNILFDIMLHVGTLLALLLYFYRDIIKLILNCTKQNKIGRQARLIALATLPAVVGGLLFGRQIDTTLRSPIVVVVTLVAVGLLMLFAEHVTKNRQQTDAEMSKKQALKIGFAQAIALIPGVSRSGITITTGMLTGLGREQAARFSFLLAIPIIAGSAAGSYIRDSNTLTIDVVLVVGIVAAFVSGLLAIKFLLGVIGRVGLKPFAYYRFLLAAIVLLLVL